MRDKSFKRNGGHGPNRPSAITMAAIMAFLSIAFVGGGVDLKDGGATPPPATNEAGNGHSPNMGRPEGRAMAADQFGNPTMADFLMATNEIKDGTKILFPPLKDAKGAPEGRVARLPNGLFTFMDEAGKALFPKDVGFYAIRYLGGGLYMGDLGPKNGKALFNSEGRVLATKKLFIGNRRSDGTYLALDCMCDFEDNENFDHNYHLIDDSGKKVAYFMYESLRPAGDSMGSMVGSNKELTFLLKSDFEIVLQTKGLLMGLGNDLFLELAPGKVGIYDSAERKYYRSQEFAPHSLKISTPKGDWYFDWNTFTVLRASSGGFVAPPLLDINDVNFYDIHRSGGFWNYASFRKQIGFQLTNPAFRAQIHWGEGLSKPMRDNWPETLDLRAVPFLLHFKDKDVWYARFLDYEGLAEENGSEDYNIMEIPGLKRPFALFDGKFRPILPTSAMDAEFEDYVTSLSFSDWDYTYWGEIDRMPPKFSVKEGGKWFTYDLKAGKLAAGKAPKFLAPASSLEDEQIGPFVNEYDIRVPTWRKKYGYDDILDGGMARGKRDFIAIVDPVFNASIIDKYGRRYQMFRVGS